MPFCLSKRVCALAIGFRVCYTECQFNKSEFVRNSKFKFILLESVFREIKICYRFFPQGKDMCDMLLLLKKRRFVQKVEMV